MATEIGPVECPRCRVTWKGVRYCPDCGIALYERVSDALRSENAKLRNGFRQLIATCLTEGVETIAAEVRRWQKQLDKAEGDAIDYEPTELHTQIKDLNLRLSINSQKWNAACLDRDKALRDVDQLEGLLRKCEPWLNQCWATEPDGQGELLSLRYAIREKLEDDDARKASGDPRGDDRQPDTGVGRCGDPQVDGADGKQVESGACGAGSADREDQSEPRTGSGERSKGFYLTLVRTVRGFEWLMAPHYPQIGAEPEPVRLACQSSAVGGYPDAVERPGSSYLWISDNIHLNREQVGELRDRLSRWLETGSLQLPGETIEYDEP